MPERLHVCEQCGQPSPEIYKCNSCGMLVCAKCLASRYREAPCHCTWDTCTGWLTALEE